MLGWILGCAVGKSLFSGYSIPWCFADDRLIDEQLFSYLLVAVDSKKFPVNSLP
jgi:hypothetical protein